MHNTMRVKPAPGRTVLYPDREFALLERGETVPRSAYWLARIEDGSVVDAGPKAKKPRPGSEPVAGAQSGTPRKR